MKTWTFLFFAVLFATNVTAQEWQTYSESQGITIQYRPAEINDPQSGIHHTRIVFRYENKTGNAIQLNFRRLTTYSGDEAAKPQEKEFTVSIPANSSVEYNEANAHDKTFYLFAQDKKNTIKRSLINFDIRDVTIQ